ncbi:MAG: adenylosuccinate lyase [Deltaproteobacteria bacterium]|nr:adenylosuccinate lyase [Deltaproteobacteria bacterium]
MIERYSRKEMSKLWEPENKFKKWLEIEILACEAWAKLGEIPQQAFNNIKTRADFNIQRIDEIEKTVKHDVISFLTSVAEFVGPDSRYIHRGLTSSDILDTSFALVLREAADLIIADIKGLMAVIKKRAFEHKDTVMIGRSHGIHAEPITFGLKMTLWYEEMNRNLERIKKAKDVISYGKISGAVGTFANIPPFVEEYVCKKVGLKPAPISTQIVQRDRHAEYFTTLAIIASSIEKFAVEIRHLQRTEVLEAEEPFTVGQKGSSAMPHKRNPVVSENISGLARLMRGYASAAMENIPLWHERDISHSSVERVIAPDATTLMDFMLTRATALVKDLVVYPENMKENLDKLKGLLFSQTVLLALTENGISREDAYQIVQRNAMKVWKEIQGPSGRLAKGLKHALLKDKEVTARLSKKEIEACFDISRYVKNVDYIFKRVFKE